MRAAELENKVTNRPLPTRKAMTRTMTTRKKCGQELLKEIFSAARNKMPRKLQIRLAQLPEAR